MSGRGITAVLLGTALVVAAILGFSWYSVDTAPDVAGHGFTFADLRDNADQLVAPVASAYFHWLAWTLVIVAATAGVLANVPWPLANPLRVLGFLAGALGVIGTYYALAQLFYAQHAAGGSAHGVWHNSSLGLWSALGGYLLCAVGGMAGPRRT